MKNRRVLFGVLFLAVAVALIAALRTRLTFRSLTVDRAHEVATAFDGKNLEIAYRAVRGNQEFVVHLKRGAKRQYGPFDHVEALQFSAEGDLAFIARDGEKSRAKLFFGDRQIAEHDSIQGFKFSPDGKRFAYTGEDGNKAAIYVDGKREALPTFSWHQVFFSEDGRSVFYVATEENPRRRFVVLNGVAGPEFDDVVGDPVLLKNGELLYVAEIGRERRQVKGTNAIASGRNVYQAKRDAAEKVFANVVETENGTKVVANGQEGPEFAQISDSNLVVSPDGKFVAYAGVMKDRKSSRWVVNGVLSEKSYPRISEFKLDPRSGKIALQVSEGQYPNETSRVIYDGTEGPEFDSISNLRLGPTGDVTYLGTRKNETVLIRNGKKSGAFERAELVPTTVGASGPLLIARKGSEAWLITEDQMGFYETDPADLVKAAGFDAKGSLFSVVRRDGRQWLTVVDQESASYVEVYGLIPDPRGSGTLAVVTNGTRMQIVDAGKKVWAEDEGIGEFGVKANEIEGRKEFQIANGKVEAYFYRQEYSVKLNGETIYHADNTVGGRPVVTDVGRVGETDLILLDEYSGDGCPSTKTLLMIKSVSEIASSSFGNCSDAVLSKSPSRWKFRFPAFSNGVSKHRPEVWVFENGRLSRPE